MSKRNITYVKPEEPSFLKRIKQQAGYKEGPTVDTKRQDLGPAEDFSDTEEEQPTVVVLKEGDLTADEVSKEKERLEREAAEAPADLSSPIVFKAPNKGETAEAEVKPSKRPPASDPESRIKTKKLKNKTLLSFNDEEDDD